MLKFAVIALVLVTQTVFAFEDKYPKNPNPNLTPGELCDHADTYRYPERIAYCERNVDTYAKRAVIANYDAQLGYRIRSMSRGDFKIDHYIPLCMGGSNRPTNLWPQHKSVYTITDPLEALLCEKMAEGRLKQADAIDMIKEAKNDLAHAHDVLRRAHSL